MTRFAVLALLCLTAAATATGASAWTKTSSFQKARTCLLKSAGATFVGHRGDGGGFATFGGHGSSFWTYKTFLGNVSDTTVYFAGAASPATKVKVKACLSASM